MTTTKVSRSAESGKSIKLYNPNHYGPGPQGGQFAPGGGSDGGGESEHGGGNPHRHPLTGRYSTSTERLQAKVEEARQVHAAAYERYVTTQAAVRAAAREYFTSPAHQAAHADAVHAHDQALHEMLDAQRHTYSLQTDLESRRFGEGKYRFIPANAQTTENTASAMREIFGRELSVDELGELASATRGDELHVTPRQFRGVWRMEVISASHDWRDKGDITRGARYTWRDIIKSPTSGRIRIINQYNRDATPERLKEPGAGTKRLARQVETAARLGVSHLETHAAGNAFWAGQGKKVGFNGYYTWARLGYNARIPTGYRLRLPDELRQTTTIGGLMRSKAGRDWWKANGGDWTGKFALKPGSYSRQTLNAYMQVKGYSLSDAFVEPFGWTLADGMTTTTTQRPAHHQPQRSERDADYQRVKTQAAARLKRSLRVYARDLRVGGQDGETRAQTAFIRRQTTLLRQAYADGHREGLRDYWQAVSLKRPRFAPPDARTLHQRVAFYLPSVVKMALELPRAWHETQRQQAARGQTPVKQFASPDTVDVSALDAALASMDWRVQLQAEVSWVGLQEGYAAGGAADPAGVYDVIYWDLEPVKTQHCLDCILVSEGSPYTIQTLNQTPGDGRTECGAGCHCDLRYGSSPQAAPAPIAARVPSDYPIERTQASGSVPLPPAEGALGQAQKQGLDDVRSAMAGWERVRGDLPALDTLLAPESEAEASQWRGVSVEDLTPAQRSALDGYVEALGQWGAASSADAADAATSTEEAGSAIWNVPPIELPQRPTDGAYPAPKPLPPEMQLPGVPPIVLPERPTYGPLPPPNPLPPEMQLPGVPPIELPERPTQPGGRAGVQQTTDTATVNGATTRDIVRVTTGEDPAALAQLNAGQRQAVDNLRGVELLWDAMRGDLPAFATYFDPASAHNLWQNRDLTGLDTAQREVVRRYFQAVSEWQAATGEPGK